MILKDNLMTFILLICHHFIRNFWKMLKHIKNTILIKFISLHKIFNLFYENYIFICLHKSLGKSNELYYLDYYDWHNLYFVTCQLQLLGTCINFPRPILLWPIYKPDTTGLHYSSLQLSFRPWCNSLINHLIFNHPHLSISY